MPNSSSTTSSISSSKINVLPKITPNNENSPATVNRKQSMSYISGYSNSKDKTITVNNSAANTNAATKMPTLSTIDAIRRTSQVYQHNPAVITVPAVLGAERRHGSMSDINVPSENSVVRRVSITGISQDDCERLASTDINNNMNMDTNEFSALDDQLVNSPIYRELYRIVRLCAAQPSCDRMIELLEQQCKPLVHSTGIRCILVQRDGLVHHTWSQIHPLNSGLIGYVRSKREVLNLNSSIENDARYNPEIDNPIHNTTDTISAMIIVPIEADSTLTGTGSKDVVAVLQAYRTVSSTLPSYKTSDCKILYRLGEFVGNMLRNSRSVDRTHAMYHASLQSHKRSAALLDIAKILASTTSLSSVVSIIVSQVPELLDCDRCTLFFVDKSKQELIVTKGSSRGREKSFVSWIFGQCNAPELPFQPGQNELRFSMKNGLAGHVASTGELLNIVDAHTDARFNSAIDAQTGYRTRSILCAPMYDSNNECIGVLQAINKSPLYPRFDTQDETLLLTFGAQAALAVRNSQLFTQTKQALLHSDALLSVTQALSSELNMESLIGIICTQVQKLQNAERCTVFIIDTQQNKLYTSGTMSFGMGPSLPIDSKNTNVVYFPLDRGIAGSVATTGQIVNIPDAYADTRFNQKMDAETGFRTRAILCLPIINHKKVIVGVLQVMNKRITVENTAEQVYVPFDTEDEKMLHSFCTQAAVAIENSRLFTETEKALNHALNDQRNLRFMLSVTKNLFSDMHLTSMVNQLTMQVYHLLKADDCVLYLMSDDGQTYYLAKDNDTTSTHVKHAIGTGIVGTVAQTGQSIRINRNASSDSRFNPIVDQRKNKVTHSILCCPITVEISDKNGSVIGTRVVGIISVRDEKDRGGFEQEEEKLLHVFCAQASVAIVNAKRYGSMLESSNKEFLTKAADTAFATDYLIATRGMKLNNTNVDNILFSMNDIQLKGSIGTGSYGEVYKAIVKNQVVAVKKLHVKQLKSEQLDSFCSEASLMCQLQHENIVGFIGAVTEPSNLCIITQYCSRGSMADLLLDHTNIMTFPMKCRFALHAAQGMLYLHTSNPVILHRDLKSDNLLITHDWICKVGDFGLTRFISEKKQMTQVGTPMWMAPEIICGKKYTEKADVYAFGIILWEIMTRLEPYEDKEPMQIVVEVVNDNLRPVVPVEYNDNVLLPLMKDCWATDAESRPSFEKIVKRLEQICTDNPIDEPSKLIMYGKDQK